MGVLEKKGGLPKKIEVTPSDIWKVASHAMIGDEDVKNFAPEKIPIRRVPGTAWVDIKKSQFEEGVVVLNNRLPGNPKDYSTIRLRYIISTEDEVKKLKIDENGKWPTGYVVLWK